MLRFWVDCGVGVGAKFCTIADKVRVVMIHAEGRGLRVRLMVSSDHTVMSGCPMEMGGASRVRVRKFCRN